MAPCPLTHRSVASSIDTLMFPSSRGARLDDVSFLRERASSVACDQSSQSLQSTSETLVTQNREPEPFSEKVCGERAMYASRVPTSTAFSLTQHSNRDSFDTSKTLAPSVDTSVPAVCASLLSLKAGSTARPSLNNYALTPPTWIESRAVGSITSRAAGIQPLEQEPIQGLEVPNLLQASPLTSNIGSCESEANATAAASNREGGGRGFWETVMASADAISTDSSSLSPSPFCSISEREHCSHVSQRGAPQSFRAAQTSVENSTENYIPTRQTRTPAKRLVHTQIGRSDSQEFVSNDRGEIEAQMNIPCVMCGVRFRKPGHLNMHWRSVHATHPNTSYPGSYASDATAMTEDNHVGVDIAPRRAVRRMPSSGVIDLLDKRCRIAKQSHAYGCPQCSARFRRGSDRNRHMRMVHERRRPFACEMCPKQFGRKSFLEAHVLTVHEKRRPFGCVHCGAAFGQRSSLTRHTRKIHGIGQ